MAPTQLSKDAYERQHFHYCVSNPPFGKRWEKDQAFVESEAREKGLEGRFGAGTPRVSDGSMLFIQHLVDKLERPERGGGRAAIILSGSPLFTGNAGQGNYTATKAGMIGMFKSIGKEYAKRGVTANCVAPGFIATPMTEKLNDKQREAILQMVPAGRLGAGSDVAAAVVYLASNEAAYVTGQTLHVNGGMAMI